MISSDWLSADHVITVIQGKVCREASQHALGQKNPSRSRLQRTIPPGPAPHQNPEASTKDCG